MATKPFAQPTARSLLESQVKHVHRVFGGRASNAGESSLTTSICYFVLSWLGGGGTLTVFCGRVQIYFDPKI